MSKLMAWLIDGEWPREITLAEAVHRLRTLSAR